MNLSLSELPMELLVEIAEWLRPPDLAQLSRVSKIFAFAQTMLWERIELHSPYSHKLQEGENNASFYERPFVFDVSTTESWDSMRDHRMRVKTAIFFRRGLSLRSHTRWRWDFLARNVKSLCLSVFPGDAIPLRLRDFNEMRNLLLDFANLEHLSCYGNQFDINNVAWDDVSFTHAQRFLYHLKTVSLRGYFPPWFVRAVLAKSQQLQRLDLALLRPEIGADRIMDTSTTHEPDEGQDIWKPRSFRWFQEGGITSMFDTLTHLSLEMPGGPLLWNNTDVDDLPFDSANYSGVLLEWRMLIHDVRSTIQSLKLEVRQVVNSRLFLITNSEDVRITHESASPADTQFCRAILPMFFDEDAQWPFLSILQFRGIDLDSAGEGSVLTKLQERLPDTHISVSEGRHMAYQYNPPNWSCPTAEIYQIGDGFWSNIDWAVHSSDEDNDEDEEGEEEAEEEGEGEGEEEETHS